jgi:hypothetical protein
MNALLGRAYDHEQLRRSKVVYSYCHGLFIQRDLLPREHTENARVVKWQLLLGAIPSDGHALLPAEDLPLPAAFKTLPNFTDPRIEGCGFGG